MIRILVVEGNTPELMHRRTQAGLPWSGESYGMALRHFAPDLEIEITRPYFPDWSLDSIDLATFDGMAVTGSGVDWSASDARAEPFWRIYEKAFAAGVPVLGSCWGLQNGAVVLGGETNTGPNGVELGFARDLTLTEAGKSHPLHHARAPVFDALCIHRDDVTRPPDGALVTASNDHTAVQGMVYEVGSTCFWGVQYHPEMTLKDIAYIFRRNGSLPMDTATELEAMALTLGEISADPESTRVLQDQLGVGPDLTDFDTHGLELRNWLRSAVIGAALPSSDEV